MTNIPDEERQRVLAGLERLKRRPEKLAAMVGPPGARRIHMEQKIRMTALEHAAMRIMGHALACHVGRPVGLTLVTRLALRLLLKEVSRSMKDPAVAARLVAELHATREERAADHA